MAAALHQSYLSTGTPFSAQPAPRRWPPQSPGGRQAQRSPRQHRTPARPGAEREPQPLLGRLQAGPRCPAGRGRSRSRRAWAGPAAGPARPLKVHLELYIDKSREAKLQLATGHNTCVFIDRFPCSLLSDLSIDAMDITGEQQQDVEHKPFKQCLDKAAHHVTPEVDRHGLLPYLCCQPPLGLLSLNRLFSLLILSTERKRNLQGVNSLIQERHFESDQITLHATSNFFCCLEKVYS
ncbi:uncharacterized protein LOC106112186 [Falco peregrinus]|uniref:uncharacterized protein LOC106112186 n=1 Tax=Falco peregrinus TaxID=8954 RepID=UPI00247915DE|nr:uncharacterized protein LOC106112186 [Falco peregrinus]